MVKPHSELCEWHCIKKRSQEGAGVGGSKKEGIYVYKELSGWH